MPCLAHDRRFASVFQAIINVLRKEERIPSQILRSMARRCCMCKENETEQMTLVPMNDTDDHQWMKTQNIYERLKKIEPNDNQLIRSFNRLEQIIRENRATKPMIVDEPVAKPIQNRNRKRYLRGQSNSSMDSSSDRMSEGKEKIQEKKKRKRRPKQIKTGSFVFLPYSPQPSGNRNTGRNDPLLVVAQFDQVRRFLGRGGHFAQMQQQYGVRLNMITPKTSSKVTEALENAQNHLAQLTIHNPPDASANGAGIWVLIRPKKGPKKSDSTLDMKPVVEDLINRWSASLNIAKRPNDADDGRLSQRRKTRRQ